MSILDGTMFGFIGTVVVALGRFIIPAVIKNKEEIATLKQQDLEYMRRLKRIDEKLDDLLSRK